MPYVKRLTTIGNSAAIILDQPFLKQLGLKAGDNVELSVENNAIVIRPHRPAPASPTRWIFDAEGDNAHDG